MRDPIHPFIGVDIIYDFIRDDPCFRDLLKRLKLDVFFPETVKKNERTEPSRESKPRAD